MVDVEQVVIRSRLVLGVLLRTSRSAEARVRAALELALAPLGMEVEVTAGDADEGPHRRGRSHVTVLGHPLRPAALAGIAGCIADYGGNIDRIVRIAHYPVTAVQLEVSGADPMLLREQLAPDRRDPRGRRGGRAVRAAPAGQAAGGDGRRLHPRPGRGDRDARRAGRLRAEVAAVTEAAMRGDLDFADSLRARVRLLAGLDEAELTGVRDDLVLARGARTFVRTLKRLDYRIAVVSGGFTQVTDGLVEDLGIDYSAANTLEIVDGRLTGELLGPVVDRAGKADALERFAREAGVPVSQTVAIGDGANDLDMLARAGLGIAYNAKPVVRVAARRSAERAVPGRDPVPARHLPDGDRGGGRGRGHRGARAADLTGPTGSASRARAAGPWCRPAARRRPRPASARAGHRSGS